MLTLRTHDIMIFGGINGKLLQKTYFLKNAKKTCKPNNHDLNRDWIKYPFWQPCYDVLIIFSSQHVLDTPFDLSKVELVCL